MLVTGLLIAATILLWGITPILEKAGLSAQVGPLTGLVIRNSAIFGALVLILLFRPSLAKEVMSADSRTIILFSLSGLLAGLVAMLTYFSVLKMDIASRVVPICAAFPLVTAILSVLLLKESFSPLRMLGTGLIVAGVWLVSIK